MKTEEQKTIDGIIAELSYELKTKQARILKIIAGEVGEANYSFQQFNGRFGGKNNIYVDSVRTQFLDFDDFYAQWLKGLIDLYEEDRDYFLNNYGYIPYEKASFINLRLMQIPEVEAFVKLFLERSFYNRIHERTRSKPDENLWSIWFGDKLCYGLVIAPVKRKDGWTNDKSEIRRVKYAYWTIGHVLSEGLIDPALDSPISFHNSESFIQFYQSILKRISNSQHEQAICDRYVEYLKASEDIEKEPLLIPEVRYAGLQKRHEYRLDFTILNAHTSEYVGFEISPASTHMTVSKLKEKQRIVNDELKDKWEREMKKRNSYFQNYGISVMTFTDSDLTDIDRCFETIKARLINRGNPRVKTQAQLERLSSIK